MTKNAVAVRPTPAPAVSSESKTLTMGPVSMRRGPPSEAAPKRRSYGWQPYQPLAPSLVTGRANAAPMPSECRANAVPGQIDARGTAPHHAPPPCTPPPEAAPGASAGSSGRHADHPPAETDLAIQPRPAHVAGVPAAGVPDGDAASVVADPDEPVPLPEPACAIHQQRALVQPGLQLDKGSQRSQLAVGAARLTRTESARSQRACQRRPARTEQAESRRDAYRAPDQGDRIVEAPERLAVGAV